MLEKKIALLTSVTFNNIGNGFIDLGAEAALMKALPLNAELFKVSSNANFAATMGQMFMLKENPIINWLWVHTMQRAAKKLHDRSYKTVKTQNIFSMASMVKCDYFIIPGCVLTVPFFTIYGDLIKRKAEQGSKIIFLGASGNFYTEYEVKFVSEYLRKLQPYAIMTRDSLAYKYYANFTKNSYNGIDNVFFVNLLNLPQIDTDLTPYVVLNIEEPKHYRIKEELKNIFKEKNILENVNRVGEYLGKKLDEIAAGSKVAKEARGMGLMRGLECDAPVGEICAKALDKGLLLLTAGTNVIRFVPPLVIKEEHVDQMAEILTEVLKEFE